MGFWDVLHSLDWQNQSYPSSNDFVLLPLSALFFPLVRLILDRFLFEKIGKKLMFGKTGQLKISEVQKKKKLRKFKESAWKCVYYLSAEILALSVTYDEPWFTNTIYFWQGPADQVWPDQKMKMKSKGLYIYVAGFYLYAIFALVFWETRRSDFGVSMSHHIATAILIISSYITSCEDGHLLSYCGAETIANISFILFAISWVVLRLTYYPFWILWSTSYEVLSIVDMEKHPVKGPIIYYYVFNTLLYWLLVLNIYWGVLIFRMLMKKVLGRGKLTDDVRSDSEDEDSHEA